MLHNYYTDIDIFLETDWMKHISRNIELHLCECEWDLEERSELLQSEAHGSGQCEEPVWEWTAEDDVEQFPHVDRSL